MPRPDTVVESVATAINESDRLPDSTTYATFEIDQDGGQSDLRPPIVEITITDTIRSKPHNTDLADYVTDDSGNRIGRIYRALFEMSLQIDVWTAEGGPYDKHEVGEAVRRALYRYDSHQYDAPLPDPDDPTTDLSGIDYVSVGEGSVQDDLAMTPSLRRWRQTVDVWFSEEVNTVEAYGPEPYVANVITPSASDAEGGTGDVEIVLEPTT